MSAVKTFEAIIEGEGAMHSIALPFDPKVVLGKIRAPVKVTVNGYTFRTTVVAMGGPPCIGLRKSHREAAGVERGDTVTVRVELDTDERVVTPPADLVKALDASPGAWDRWRTLSYTHQREHAEAIEGAKAPDTRARRIARTLSALTAAAAPRR